MEGNDLWNMHVVLRLQLLRWHYIYQRLLVIVVVDLVRWQKPSITLWPSFLIYLCVGDQSTRFLLVLLWFRVFTDMREH
jgi:hypothetical protein